jgi:hypothetical protein
MSTDEGALLALFYDSLLGVSACAFAYFLYFETRTHGRELCSNKFVLITIAGNASCLLTMIFVIAEIYRFYGQTSIRKGMLDFASTFCIIITLYAHVSLVYLRSNALFSPFSKALKAVQILGLSFVISGVVVIILSFCLSLTLDETFRIPFQLFSLLTGVLLGTIDVISTYTFYKHVKEIYSTLNDSLLMKEQRHVKQTQLIARRGLVICFMSATSLLFYLFDVITFDTLAQYYPIAADGIIFIFQVFLTTIMILWMTLKIELDEMEKVRIETVSENTEVLLKDFSNKVSSQDKEKEEREALFSKND